ncbi:MAG: KEOPS complex subunit Pcc1 [Candidatus Micrarchaeia archaeon]
MDYVINTTITTSGAYAKALGLKKFSKYKRSTMSASVKRGKLVIQINSEDMTAMRAAVNSVLRDLQVAASAIPLKGKKSKVYKDI